MKFCKYSSTYQQMGKETQRRYNNNPLELYEELITRAQADMRERKFSKSFINSVEHELIIEFTWYACQSPYYNLYPCVIDMVKKLPKDLPLTPIELPDAPHLYIENPDGEALYDKPTQALEIRFPEGHYIRSCVLSLGLDNDAQKMCAIVQTNEPSSYPDEPWKKMTFNWLQCATETLETVEANIAEECKKAKSPKVQTMMLEVVQTLQCLGMLTKKDLGLLDRDLCSNDEGKELTDAVLRRATARKGLGWNLGKTLQNTPHTRRPHFAIRWTGKGSTVPKLVPVKGSVVNRKQLTKVPTGYETQNKDSHPSGDK